MTNLTAQESSEPMSCEHLVARLTAQFEAAKTLEEIDEIQKIWDSSAFNKQFIYSGKNEAAHFALSKEKWLRRFVLLNDFVNELLPQVEAAGNAEEAEAIWGRFRQSSLGKIWFNFDVIPSIYNTGLKLMEAVNRKSRLG